MPGRVLTRAFPLLLFALPALGAGCDGGGTNGEITPGVSPSATTAVTVTAEKTAVTDSTATPSPDIREQNLTDEPGLRNFLASAGGEVDTGRIIYRDLTEDGVDDAVVPVSSGGEGGDIAAFVFAFGAGGLHEVLQVVPDNASLKVNVVDGVLTVTEPVFAPGDPLCCPSELRKSTYRWEEGGLVIDRQETAPAEEN